jgi:uncharacterized repeat protein (TIGR01451 family)
VGLYTALEIVNGNPAISYYDFSNGALRYVRATDVNGTAWGTPVSVDTAGGVGEYTSLTIVSGNPAISYFDSANGDLKYVRATDADGSAWNTPLSVDTAGIVGLYTALEIVNGNPAISYFDIFNNDLKFARACDADGTSWLTTCVVASADLSITKTDGSATAVPGATVTYTIIASNAGPRAVVGATVSDTFPAVLTGVTWTCVGAGGGTCTAAGSGNISDTVNLPASGSVTYTATGTLSASALGTLANTATVTSAVTDPAPANNSATDTNTLTPQADLSITKTDGSATAVPGATVTYTIIASNAGPSAVVGATVSDTFPAVLTGVTWTCVGAGGGTCTAAGSGNISDTVNLPASSSVTYTATGTLSASALGTLANTATVTSAVTDPAPANNSATDTNTLTPQADLSITKTDGATTTIPGATVTYTIIASNAGPSAVVGATVSDTFPAVLTGVTWTCVGAGGGTCTAAGSGNISDTVNLPASSSVTYTATGTLSASATGTLANTATVTSAVTDPAPGNNSATDTNTLTTAATVSISASTPTAAENPASNGQFVITMSAVNTTGTGITVNYTVTGSATPGTDYGTLSGTAVIPDGSNFVTIDVLMTGFDDFTADPAETVIVTLNSTSNPAAAIIGTPDNATVTIADDETAGYIISPLTPATLSEPSGAATFSIRLSALPTGTVTLDFTSLDLTECFPSPPTTLTFDNTNWNVAFVITFNVTDDLLPDGSQFCPIAITRNASSTAAEYNALPDPANLVLTVLDNETPPVVVPPPSGDSGTTTTMTTTTAAPQIAVFDPAISKLGFLVPGQLGARGEQLEWVVTVTNTGGAAGNNVVVTDTLRSELRIDRVNAPDGTVNISGQTVSVTFTTIQPGQTFQFSIFTTVTAGVTVDNTACVQAAGIATECFTAPAITSLPATGEPPWWAHWLRGLVVVLLVGSGLFLLYRRSSAKMKH